MNIKYELNDKVVILISIITVVALVLRLYLVLAFPQISGDQEIYLKFSENIFRGCGFSQTDLDNDTCIPTTAGYFPGYPFFISVIWSMFGKSNNNILIAQAVLHWCAIVRLIFSVNKIGLNKFSLLFFSVFILFSPLQIGWSRLILTESLALTCAIWLLAESINCIYIKEFKIIVISIPFVLSVFVRPDSIFLIIIPLILWFYTKKSIKKIIIFTSICAFPISGWMIRNYEIDGYLLSMTVEHAPVAPGYFRWVNSWVVTEHERAEVVFPFWSNKAYSQIQIPYTSNLTNIEIISARSELLKAKDSDGDLFPLEIDHKFNEMAAHRESNLTTFYLFALTIKRAVAMLLNPLSSWGLPIEIKPSERILLFSSFDGSFSKMSFDWLSEMMGVLPKVFIKLILFSYRFLLVIFLLIGGYYVFFRSYLINSPFKLFQNDDINHLTEFLYLIAFSITFIKLCFFVYLVGLESRYLIQTIPFIELSVLMFIYSRFHQSEPSSD